MPAAVLAKRRRRRATTKSKTTKSKSTTTRRRRRRTTGGLKLMNPLLSIKPRRRTSELLFHTRANVERSQALKLQFLASVRLVSPLLSQREDTVFADLRF